MKEVWRYNDERMTVEKVVVKDITPLNFLIPSWHSQYGGSYINCENLKDIKSIAKKDIEDKIKYLQEVLESIQNIQDI